MRKKKKEENWKISTEERQLFLGAVESLKNNRDSLTKKKFDFIEDKTFTPRKKKASYREPGEKIKATLDLHGMLQNEVIARLDEFCQDCSYQAIRTIMVITGKGIHSLHGKSILKEHIIHWLNSKSGLYFVEFYRTGSRREGGEGVLILYLYKSSNQ